MKKLSYLLVPLTLLALSSGCTVNPTAPYLSTNEIDNQAKTSGDEVIKLDVKLVDAGSKVLGDKFKDEEFRKAVEEKINKIWEQVEIKFTIDDKIEKLDGKGKKKKFEHHDKDKGTIHIFLVPGNNAETEFKDNKNPKPGEAIATVGDGRFKELTSKSPDPNSDEERKLTACEALSETIAHELGHVLGLKDVDTSHVIDSWKNIMWTRRKSRMGTKLGSGAGDLRRDQRKTSRKFAQAIADIEECRITMFLYPRSLSV